MDNTKTVKEKKELYIEFSEEEIKELGWKDNQKLSIDLEGDAIIIKPWVTIELDTSNWPKEIFELLVQMSLEQNKTVNDVIVDIITNAVNKESKTSEQILLNE